MRRILIALVSGVLGSAFLGACSSSTPGPSGPADSGVSVVDGQTEVDAAPGTDGAIDAAVDVGPNNALPNTCESTCQKLTLGVLVGAKTDVFARAQFGFNANGTLQVEAHKGGDVACPTQSSPTPDFTVVIANVPFPTSSAPVTSGVAVSFLDFKGDLTDKPVLKAKSVTLTPVAARGAPKDTAFVAFKVDATLDQGQIEGHVYATHCASLDQK
jgi:hypothetical protein